MPVAELFAPPPEIAARPAVAVAARLAADLLEPHAQAADDPTRGVDPAHLAALADAGLMSVQVPVSDGGLGASEVVDAEAVELLSAVCGATWFVMTQHRLAQNLARQPVPAALPAGSGVAGPAAARYRGELCRASRRAGIATTHTRRPGPPAVRAEADPRGGYLLSGRADWCTGWGMLDLLLVAGATAGGQLVFALLPAREQPGLRPTAALPLAVMGGTRTVALELDGLPITPEDLVLTVDATAWRDYDLARTANTTPAAMGLLRRVLVELERAGVQRDRPAAVELAAELAEPAAKLRAEAYALLTQVPADEQVAQRSAVRAEIAELTVRAAHALIAAKGGAAMLLSSPEQRWAREASFHLVQAQTAAVRTAQLRAFGGGR